VLTRLITFFNQDIGNEQELVCRKHVMSEKRMDNANTLSGSDS